MSFTFNEPLKFSISVSHCCVCLAKFVAPTWSCLASASNRFWFRYAWATLENREMQKDFIEETALSSSQRYTTTFNKLVGQIGRNNTSPSILKAICFQSYKLEKFAFEWEILSIPC